MEEYRYLTSIPADLDDAYCLMGQDGQREVEALEWIEAVIGDGFWVAAADGNG